MYGVEVRVTNKGPPLADSFVLTEHHRSISSLGTTYFNLVSRLTSTGPNSCHYLKVAKVEFLKYSLLKGKIESETWAGIAKAEEILEERFHDIDRDSNSEGKQAEKEKSKNKTEKTISSSKKMSTVNLHPDNWKVGRERGIHSKFNHFAFSGQAT